MENERAYIRKRILTSRIQSIPFYLFRLAPIKKSKIVFCCIEGTTGYTCNPKYIAKELLQCNEKAVNGEAFELVWLVNDMSKKFPAGIRKVHNTLWNRAYHLATAHIWIDNSRKQLEVRKRKGQIYIQTWHAKLGFKPTCLDRGASFSRIAYLVSKHDSDMVDCWLSNSDWYDKTLPTGSLYEGKTLRTGSPRCDILVRARENDRLKSRIKEKIIKRFLLQDCAKYAEDIHFMMYAPTFRGGSQGTDRAIESNEGMTNYDRVMEALEKRFGGKWYILLRLHPQLVARNLDGGMSAKNVIDVSRIDDMYALLAGCDAFMTDYSSAAFDAAVMKIPVFLYADDYQTYEQERGKLLWDLRKLPFPLATDEAELQERIEEFDDKGYREGIEMLFEETGMVEDGRAAERVAEDLNRWI